MIEDISVNNQLLEDRNLYGQKVLPSFKYNQNNFTFNYTAVCFDDYDQVRYRYKLEGLDKTWSHPCKTLTVQYANLKPGKYRFVVDASYKGSWSELNQSVSFVIR